MLVVVDAADSPDLATLDTVKAALGITGTDQDDQLEALITSASAAIQSWCNRVLVEEGVEETFRSGDTVMLSRYPISDLTSITDNGSELDESAYQADLATGIIDRLSGCWGRVVVAAYISGYELADMPSDIVQALCMLVQTYMSQAARDPLLRAEEVSDVERLEWQVGSDAVPMAVQALLQPHRRSAGA